MPPSLSLENAHWTHFVACNKIGKDDFPAISTLPSFDACF
jgi:hypothetical protein